MITAAPPYNTVMPEGEPSPDARISEALILAGVTLVLLVGLLQYLDNCFVINANGLWKSVYVRMWASSPATAPVDFANLLYFPVYGLLCRLLDAFGIFVGQTWRQMALLNTVFASIGVGLIYLWIATAFRSRLIGLLAAVFYLGTGFFLALAVINEDIMPSYVWTLTGMMLGALWFGRPSPTRIVLVALVVSVGWLFEWRLMFPVVPPMLLALWLSARRWTARLRRVVLFAAGLTIVPLLLTSSLMVRGTCTRTAECLQQMFWTGKGLGTGWAGFSWVKVKLAWVGMVQSLIGGRFIGSDHWSRHLAHVLEAGVGTLLLIVLALGALRYAWKRRGEPCVVAHLIVFGGTFCAGQVFNLYSQPHDPQMQLTVMPWVILGWAVMMSLLTGQGDPLTGTHNPGPAPWRMALAAVLCLLPLVYNASVLAQGRGGDTRYLSLLARLEQHFDPAHTVFLYRGFEFEVPWKWATWSATNPGVEGLSAAPSPAPRFKWISVAETLIRHPDWSAEQQAADLRAQVDRALSLGYQVIASEIWVMPRESWVEQLVTIGDTEHIEAIHDALKRGFSGEPVLDDPVAGAHYRLTHRHEPEAGASARAAH